MSDSSSGALIAVVVIMIILFLVLGGVLIWWIFFRNGGSSGLVGPTGPTGPSGSGKTIIQHTAEITIPPSQTGVITITLPTTFSGANFYFVNLVVPGLVGGVPTVLVPSGPYQSNVPVRWNAKLTGTSLSLIFEGPTDGGHTNAGVRITAIL